MRQRQRETAGSVTQSLVTSAGELRPILHRYVPYAVAAALLVGGLAWWLLGDVVGGAAAAVFTAIGAFIGGWGLEPFLPPERRASSATRSAIDGDRFT